MNIEFLLYAIREGLKTLLLLITPVMLVPMIVGIVISVFQAITQIQDQLLNFLPKFILMMLVIFFGLPYATNVLSNYFNNLMTAIPSYI